MRARDTEARSPKAEGRSTERGCVRRTSRSRYSCSWSCGHSRAPHFGLRTSDFGLRIGLLQFIVVVILGLCPLLARADIPASAFEAANKLYEEGKFSDAATAYAKLLQGGQTSAALYFNLGNAFFRSGQIGRAIAAYRLAGQLTPRDPDVRANLQFARNQTQGPTLSSNRWQRWLGRLTLNELTVLAACAVWLWLVLLAVLQWRPSLRPALKSYVIGLGLAALALCAVTGVALYQVRSAPVAIVIAKDAVVHNGPFPESPAAFTAHDGAELRVTDRMREWLQVSAGPRQIGWVSRDEVLVQ